MLTTRCSYNKYTQIAARALRQSLQENQRVAAEKRGLTILRYQKWENGVGGQQVSTVICLSAPARVALFPWGSLLALL